MKINSPHPRKVQPKNEARPIGEIIAPILAEIARRFEKAA